MAILYEVGYELFSYEECQDVVFRTLDQIEANRVRDIISGEIRTQELNKPVYKITFKLNEEDRAVFDDEQEHYMNFYKNENPKCEQVYPIQYIPWDGKLAMVSGATYNG